MDDLRKVDALVGDAWKPIKFVDIRKGDTFRLFDTGMKIKIEDGTPNLALSDPYVKDGVDTIRCEEIK